MHIAGHVHFKISRVEFIGTPTFGARTWSKDRTKQRSIMSANPGATLWLVSLCAQLKMPWDIVDNNFTILHTHPWHSSEHNHIHTDASSRQEGGWHLSNWPDLSIPFHLAQGVANWANKILCNVGGCIEIVEHPCWPACQLIQPSIW